MRGLLRRSGIDENEFFKACNSSFKFGVRFEGWNLNDRGVPYNFLHGFGGQPPDINGVPLVDLFMTFGAQPGRHELDVVDSMSAIAEAVRFHRAPRPLAAETYARGNATRYAYHLDAQRFAVFLRDFCLARGVIHIQDDVDDATVGENGHITHLKLRREGVRPVELVIDCTGFQGLLVTKLLGEPFDSYGQHLLCDRAIPIQIPHGENAPLQVCTSATAMSAGWIWKVPLFSRIGTGYVYSSAFRSDEEAVREICTHLALDPEKTESRVIRMRVGRLRRSWVGNCIAIGLSGGFIEPLEATAIQTIDFAATTLVDNFPTRQIAPALADRFNRRMNLLYDGIRDFITMHYYASNRPEPFWAAARAPSVLSDSLRANLELWQHRLPMESDVTPIMLFGPVSYTVCLASKGYFRRHNLPIRSTPPRGLWARYGQIVERQRGQIRNLPTARQLLTHARGETRSDSTARSAEIYQQAGSV
jgi:tryptophan halogenase